MYSLLIFLHSLFRWLVLLSLLYAIIRAYRGYTRGLSFARADHLVRHSTATIAHIQLTIGIVLYTQSPIVKLFFRTSGLDSGITEQFFFGVVHISIMVTAIVLLTIGSALAKRRSADRVKFRTMLIWFILALVLILIAIPWPFSPLAQRPYLRSF